VPDPILKVSGVGQVFAPEDGARSVEALRDISFEVHPREFVAIVGPSGCGKSTLCELVAGLLRPTQGTLLLKGEPIWGPHPGVGFVFQEDSTLPWLTARENVGFGLRMRGVPRAGWESRATRMMELVGLSGFEHHYPRQLSGGMRQRVAIARTLVLDPELILMDEPFGALDAQTRLLLGEELLQIWQRVGATILFVTHDIAEAVRLADRVVVMSTRPGRIKRVVGVSLPRPRALDDPAALAEADRLVAMIWRDLRAEATIR
jgi:NitT/TauT family transport system ATP-binding protein